jgi:hypothetical protein
MTEPVAGADADQSDLRFPRFQRLRHVPVRAPVMRDLHRVHRRVPRPQGTALRALLCVAQEQDARTRAVQEQHDARVVGSQSDVAAARPQHMDADASHSEYHARVEAHDRPAESGDPSL